MVKRTFANRYRGHCRKPFFETNHYFFQELIGGLGLGVSGRAPI
jgi:hypothetical protein